MPITDAFADYVAALKLPETTEDEKRFRIEQLQLGLKKAIDVPFIRHDPGRSGLGCHDGGWHNTVISLPGRIWIWGHGPLRRVSGGRTAPCVNNMDEIHDLEYRKEIMEKADAIRDRAAERCQSFLDILGKRTD